MSQRHSLEHLRDALRAKVEYNLVLHVPAAAEASLLEESHGLLSKLSDVGLDSKQVLFGKFDTFSRHLLAPLTLLGVAIIMKVALRGRLVKVCLAPQEDFREGFL